MDKDVQGSSIAFLVIFVSNHNTIVSQETREILSPLSLHYILRPVISVTYGAYIAFDRGQLQ